ncbi:MAG: hypothetical protein ACR2NU_02450 [Aeoliella sp.]
MYEELEAAIASKQQEYDRISREFDELKFHVIGLANNHFHEWLWRETERIVKGSPEHAISIGKDGLRSLKDDVRALQDRSEQIITDTVGDMDAWNPPESTVGYTAAWNPPELDYDERQPSESLKDAMDTASNELALPLYEAGFIELGISSRSRNGLSDPMTESLKDVWKTVTKLHLDRHHAWTLLESAKKSRIAQEVSDQVGDLWNEA